MGSPASHGKWEQFRNQLGGISSFIPPCEFLGSNSRHWAWHHSGPLLGSLIGTVLVKFGWCLTMVLVCISLHVFLQHWTSIFPHALAGCHCKPWLWYRAPMAPVRWVRGCHSGVEHWYHVQKTLGLSLVPLQKQIISVNVKRLGAMWNAVGGMSRGKGGIVQKMEILMFLITHYTLHLNLAPTPLLV